MAWCGHEDYPCCGCDAGGGPEDAVAFLEELDPQEREFAERYMTPCPECGEMRPKDDPTMKREGMCYLCTQHPERKNSPTAQANLRHFSDRQREKDERINELEAENARLREQLRR